MIREKIFPGVLHATGETMQAEPAGGAAVKYSAASLPKASETQVSVTVGVSFRTRRPTGPYL